MSSDAPRRSASPLLLAALGGLGALAVVVALVGTVLAADEIAAPKARIASRDASVYRVGEPVPTSFGSVEVGAATRTKGLTAQDLAGQAHGIGNLVKRKDVAVSVELTLANDTVSPIALEPRAFRLALRRPGRPTRHVPASYASVKGARIAPGAAMGARLSFVAPRDESALLVEFLDERTNERHAIDLERTSGRATAAERADRGHAEHP